jgi:hypothetical protein
VAVFSALLPFYASPCSAVSRWWRIALAPGFVGPILRQCRSCAAASPASTDMRISGVRGDVAARRRAAGSGSGARMLPPRATAAAPSPAPPAVSKSGPTRNWHEQKLKHVVDSADFNKAAVDVVFQEALKMEKIRPGTLEAKTLDGYLMSTLFYEPSTRTRLSFESAMSRLGGTVLSTESAGEYSSAAKGETLEGTLGAGPRLRQPWVLHAAVRLRSVRRVLGAACWRGRPPRVPAAAPAQTRSARSRAMRTASSSATFRCAALKPASRQASQPRS